MLDDIYSDATARMKKSVEALQSDLSKLRTGRAHPSLLEHIMVPYYGVDTPLQQVANITIENPRTLTVTPWEKTMVQPIEKAIMTSDLGLNPATAGAVIRVPLPALTEERRRDLIKVVHTEVEKARVAIRNIRRDANSMVKDCLKEKTITEDDVRVAETKIQKLTDQYIAEVDKMMATKESELLTV